MRGIEGAHELSRNAPRRGKGNEVQEAVQAENKKDHARQISGDYGNGSHNRVLLWVTTIKHGANHIYVNRIDGVYCWKIQVFMAQSTQEPDHVWLVMMKAMRALTR